MARYDKQVKALYEMCAIALVDGRADLDGADAVGFRLELPIFSVGQAAEISHTHPQTLRQYDRLGLIVPQRTEGGARRYCLRDIARLVKAQHLSQDEGINLSGIARILELEEENRQLRRHLKRLTERSGSTVFTANSDGDVVEMQRSEHARQWRRDIQVRSRVLPSREDVAYDTGYSTSLVLWEY